jgi:hypothetical protein
LVEASGMIGLVFGFVLLFGLQISMHSYSWVF